MPHFIAECDCGHKANFLCATQRKTGSNGAGEKWSEQSVFYLCSHCHRIIVDLSGNRLFLHDYKGLLSLAEISSLMPQKKGRWDPVWEQPPADIAP